MDFAALEAAYSAFDSDDDVDVAIGVAHRALLRAANMPAGREQRRTLSEATNKLCAALEHNILDDPEFYLNRSTPRARPQNGPATRASSSKRARVRKVVIESDSDEEMRSTDDAKSLMNEDAPARRSTRLAENVMKDPEPSSPPQAAPVAEDVTATPMPDANGNGSDSSTSTVSDAEHELVLPVVRPKPQVPLLPLVSDRASQTPAITAEDEDTEEELERSRRAHAPRPRPVLDLDSSGDNSNGMDSNMHTGEETVIASPFRKSDGLQATPIMPNTVQMSAIAPPYLRNPISHGAAHSQGVPRANQRTDGISIEAEISAARASLSMAQEQQNNWIRSLNLEQERRMRAAQQQSVVGGQHTTGAPYSRRNTVQATQRSGQAPPIVPRSSRGMIQNPTISQTVQNGTQQRPPAPIVPNTGLFGSNIPISVSNQPSSMPQQKSAPMRPPATGGFRAAANGNALQLQIIRENLELEKQNEKLAELFAQQQFASQFQRQPAAGSQQAQVDEQRRQLQLREAARQQQLLDEQRRQRKRLEEQVRLERIRLLREAQEKKKLDLQMKELENQQKQIQERKKLILQQQIELQERQLREQQLQQQRIQEQQRSRELIQQHQAHHVQELQLQQQIQVHRQQQLLRQQQMRQQLRNQQQFAQQQFAQQQSVMQKRGQQERHLDLRAQQQLARQQQIAQRQQILQQRMQQPHVSQSHQQKPIHQVVGQQHAQNGQFPGHQQPGQKLHQTQKSEVTTPVPPVALGHGNLSSVASSISNQVASLSSALFSLNGTPDDRNLPRNQSSPAAAPGAPNLSAFPNSSTRLVKQSQSGRVESSAVNPLEIPALQVSSATVEGNVQAGFETVPKKGALGGSAPLIQNGHSMSNSGAVQTVYEGNASSIRRGRGRPRGSKNRPREARVTSANEAGAYVPSASPSYQAGRQLSPNETMRDAAQTQNNGAVQVSAGSAVKAQRMSLGNKAPRKPLLGNVAGGGQPKMTWLPDGTPVKEVPLVRSSVVDKTEIEIAPPPRLRLSKRALLEWDIEHLKGKQGVKDLSGTKRKRM